MRILGKHDARRRWRYSNTSTASTIRDDAIQHWAGKAQSHSNATWLKRERRAALKRDRSRAEGTSANGAIFLFYVIGFVGYLLMLSTVLSPERLRRGYRGAALLVLLASWSWASAIAMYVHRGAEQQAKDACILVPDPSDYTLKLDSIWEMRLPEIRSRRTSPSGSYIWEYHAILVVPKDGRPEHYNWSKKWMRFERLDPVRNPYLPKTCPIAYQVQ